MKYPEISPWQITCHGPITDYTESIFALGNGYLGMRGFDLQTPKSRPQDHAVFRAGFFEPVKPGITDMAQLPDIAGMILEDFRPTEVRQTLDLRRGILTHAWEEHGVSVRTERMISMADSQLIGVRMTVKSAADQELTIRTGMNDQVGNLPVHDDQTVEETETVRLLETLREDGRELSMRAVHSGRELHFLQTLWLNGRPVQGDEIRIYCKAGAAVTLEKRVRCLLDAEKPNRESEEPWEEHMAAWEGLWRDCDIQMDAEPEIQGALRWNIFQMLCSNAAGDPGLSIGARGLTHGRYKGNAFWDTDIFLLPFFCWHRPEAARNLIRFRTNHLPQAKALAKKQNLDGARYPWMCSSEGTEQCESWDIGLCETHITADVAYAAERMMEITGEAPGGEIREMWAETARYWRSRFTWEEEDQCFSSFFVKGPDEYCGAAVNNTYTNFLARHNVRLALRYAGDRLTEKEREDLSFFADHIAILRDPDTGTLLQDELFNRLEPIVLSREDAHEPMYRQICFDRMQRYRVLKQADLVQLMVLFPDSFTAEEKRAVWETFEPLTAHDSSLSFGVHAHLAFQLGLREEAWHYFTRSLFLDLRDELGNTGREGVHMAALGATWQALVYGAAGLWSAEGKIRLHPALPPEIRGLSMAIWHHGRRYRLKMKGKDTKLTEEE